MSCTESTSTPEASLVELRLDLRGGSAVDMLVHGGATDVTVEAGGNTLTVGVSPLDEFASSISFDPPSGVDEVTVHYRVPSDLPRSTGPTRVNPAHISFFAWVDSGLGNGSVRVELPDGFRGTNYGDDSDISLDTSKVGDQVWQASSVSSETLFTEVIARNERGLLRSTVELESTTVSIAGWADDPDWIAWAEDTVSWGVPLLEELIGQPWPESDLEILETTVPNDFGFAGFFNVWDSVIAIDDRMNTETMLHELAHAWFNGVRLEERWLIEGFAEDYSTLAVSIRTDEEVEPPEPVPAEVGGSNVAGWSRRTDDDFIAVRNYYNTSWFVLREVREELGQDAMIDVLGAMFEGRPTYGLDSDASVFPANTTPRFLDLLEEVGGSQEAASLFDSYVLNASWDGRLAERADARATLAELEAASPLAAPEVIRDRMAGWKFAEAELLIAEALPLAQQLADLDARATEVGAELPQSLVDSYEGTTRGFDPAASEVARASAALANVEAMTGGEQDDAASLFSGGVYSLAQADVAAVDDEGLPVPLLAGAGGIVLVLLMGLFLRAQFRAARRSSDVWV